jgi:hypothetical protein
MQQRELEQLMRAQKEVLDMVAQDEIALEEVSGMRPALLTYVSCLFYAMLITAVLLPCR